MNPTVTIRELRRTDTKNLLSFANELIREDTYIMLSGDPMTIQEEQVYVLDTIAAMKKKEKMRIIAVSGGKIIGSAELRRGSKRMRHVGELGVSVRESHRRQGVGRALMMKLLDCAQQWGLRMVTLDCFENNTAALSLYRSLGFVKAGVLPGALLWRGQYIGKLTLYRSIA